MQRRHAVKPKKNANCKAWAKKQKSNTSNANFPSPPCIGIRTSHHQAKSTTSNGLQFAFFLVRRRAFALATNYYY
jgi:hypothetical protein